MLLALPMILLYEAGIIAASAVRPTRASDASPSE
jgi:Sec-independent protein secretion pathway component TatC